MVTNCTGPRWFSIITPPQYHLKFGSIKYTICEVVLQLRLKKEVDWEMDNLEVQICKTPCILDSLIILFALRISVVILLI
jgi:hypothetical protein